MAPTIAYGTPESGKKPKPTPPAPAPGNKNQEQAPAAHPTKKEA